MSSAPSRSERFSDRREAGRELAKRLERHRRSDATVLGLPRGGVPVAYEVAAALDLPLDVFVVRKLGLPSQPELAMGAVASGGAVVLNGDVMRAIDIDQASFDRVVAEESAELERREHSYRDGRASLELGGRRAILVDDGLATGSSMLAAVRALGDEGASQIVVAVPIAPEDTCRAIEGEVDEVVCARTPEPFLSVGSWYEDFAQTTDDEVRRLLARAAARRAS